MKKSVLLLGVLLILLSFGCSDAVNNAINPTSINVGESSLVFSESGGSKLVAISGDAEWTAESNQAWCSVSPTSGSGNGAITITVQLNNTVTQRTAKITVKSVESSLSREIVITQAGQSEVPVTDPHGNSINVSPVVLDFLSGGGSKSIQITANVEWQIVSDQEWCGVSVSSGTGNASVEVTVDSNTGVDRYAVLTIGNTEYELSKEVSVLQTGSSQTYTYTASAGSGGTINPIGQVSIPQSENKTFTASPDTGKVVSQWIVNGSVAASTGTSYTITNVQADGTIQVTFKDEQPAIDAEKLPGSWQAVKLVTDDGTTTSYNSNLGILFTLRNDKTFVWDVQNSTPGTLKVEVKGTWTYTAVNQTIECTGTMYLGGSVYATRTDLYIVNELSDETLVITGISGTYTFNKADEAVTNFAPDSLVRGYIFARNPQGATPSGIEYWIWNPSLSRGFHSTSANNGTRISTPYTYTKTGPNTATFNYEIEQYNSIGIPPYRWWVYSGTLTYTSANTCEYDYSFKYQGSTYGSGKVTYYVYIDPSIVYLP